MYNLYLNHAVWAQYIDLNFHFSSICTTLSFDESRPRQLAWNITDVTPPWRRPKGKLMVSLVNSHPNATFRR